MITPARVLMILSVNVFVAVAFSQQYTEWSIRVRNEGAYLLTKNEKYLERARNAGETAGSILRWLRPTMFFFFNVVFFIIMYFYPP
jgi:hypothetical protein